MKNIQCFRIKRGTDFDKAVKKHFDLTERWEGVFTKVSELLDEKITKLAFTSRTLAVDVNELTKDENKKLFKQNGEIKRNTKRAKNILNEYSKIIEEEGLSEYEELRYISFRYGAMRTTGQEMESFKTSENDIYYKADFNLEKKTGGMVEPITEVQYEEKYLEELKKREVQHANT